jgi:methylated-DNA-[protein]-cysteine S-methyltransferase
MVYWYTLPLVKSRQSFHSLTIYRRAYDLNIELFMIVKKRLISDVAVRQQQLLCDELDNDGKPIQLTPFQRKVYSALCHVPEGNVTTYKSLANYINCSSNQAIGQALKRNPYCPLIPCHRVIKSDGSIGGFHGATSGTYIDNKVQLLKKEGVIFTKDGKVSPSCIYDFSITEPGGSTSPTTILAKRKRIRSSEM